MCGKYKSNISINNDGVEVLGEDSRHDQIRGQDSYQFLAVY